jgi:hypothetical protein
LRQERGNFLLQALLALGLIFAFIPFVARQMADRATDSRMYTTTNQVDVAQTASRIFIRENARDIPYETTVVSGNDFVDMLEPYGLPLGFVPRTALGQDMALVIHKTPVSVTAYLELKGGNLSGLVRAELARRIGFYASPTDTGVNVGIELADIYSDVVRRNDPNVELGGFLTELDMGNFTINNVGNLFSVRGDFESAQFDTLTVSGLETGKKVRNKIENMSADKTVFQSRTGESALSLTRGALYADSLSVRTISMFGDTGNYTFNDASVYELAMTAGSASFEGPSTWNVRGDLVSSYITFSVERLDVAGYVNVSRGQDVYIDDETLSYSSKSGLDVGVLHVSNITLRDQTSSALNNGAAGSVLLDIRPAGTTLLPDAYVSGIDNGKFSILANPAADNGDTIDCEQIIKRYSGAYSSQSLSQYLICQYVYWQRLEKRMNIKQCLMAGGSDCE